VYDFVHVACVVGVYMVKVSLQYLAVNFISTKAFALKIAKEYPKIALDTTPIF
jgi:hypothetical protein